MISCFTCLACCCLLTFRLDYQLHAFRNLCELSTSTILTTWNTPKAIRWILGSGPMRPGVKRSPPSCLAPITVTWRPSEGTFASSSSPRETVDARCYTLANYMSFDAFCLAVTVGTMHRGEGRNNDGINYWESTELFSQVTVKLQIIISLEEPVYCCSAWLFKFEALFGWCRSADCKMECVLTCNFHFWSLPVLRYHSSFRMTVSNIASVFSLFLSLTELWNALGMA